MKADFAVFLLLSQIISLIVTASSAMFKLQFCHSLKKCASISCYVIKRSKLTGKLSSRLKVVFLERLNKMNSIVLQTLSDAFHEHFELFLRVYISKLKLSERIIIKSMKLYEESHFLWWLCVPSQNHFNWYYWLHLAVCFIK